MASLTSEQLATMDQTLQPTIYGVCIVLLMLGNVSVLMRLWSQWRLHGKAMDEDYCLIAALLGADVVTVATLVAAHNGFGQHIWKVEATAIENGDSELSHLQSIFISIWLTSVFNGPCMVSIKLGLLLFYRRLFIINQRWLLIAWWANLVYAVAWAIGSTVFFILQCSPPSYYWTRLNPTLKITGKCSSATTIVGIPLILSTISDFALLVLPVLVVFRLKLARQTKFGLVALFAFGFIAVGCGIARILVLELDTETASDPTYGTVAFEILNVVELNLAIFCACIVPIFSILRRQINNSQGTPKTAGATQLKSMRSNYSRRQAESSRTQTDEYLHLTDMADGRSEVISTIDNFSKSYSNYSRPEKGIRVKTEVHIRSV